MKFLKSLFKKQQRQKIVLLLDIDGVLSPTHSIPEEIPCQIIVDDYATWVIRDEVVEWLQQLANNVEIVWISSWQERIVVLEQALHLPTSHYINIPDVDTQEEDWMKTAPIMNYIKENRNDHFIIADDDMTENFIKQASQYKVTIIKPNDTIGLSEADMKHIDQTIQEIVK